MNYLTKHMLIIVAFLSMATIAEGQLAKFKALYIYNFAKNIGWTDLDSQKGEFVITVVGDNEIASELEQIASSKKIGSRPVVIKKAATAAGLPKSQIIYLGESKSGQISQLVSSQSGNRVLLIAGKNGQCSQGAGISFVSKAGKLNYEISNRNIKKNDLVIAQKIIQLGIEVD